MSVKKVQLRTMAYGQDQGGDKHYIRVNLEGGYAEAELTLEDMVRINQWISVRLQEKLQKLADMEKKGECESE